MKELEDRIRAEGRILPGQIVKVDSFLNHQIDPALMMNVGKEFYELFKDEHVTKVLTIETSGIAAALTAGLCFGVPVVFAKKHLSLNMSGSMVKSQVTSFTKKQTYDITIASDYVKKDDRVLIIDDFLATGNAVIGLVHLCDQIGATIVGVGIVIEKAFQEGGKLLREKGLRVESLARIQAITENEVLFVEEKE